VRGQRQIARDNALREYRIARVNALLGRADGRLGGFAALVTIAAKTATSTEEIRREFERWRDNGLLLNASGFFGKWPGGQESPVESEFKNAIAALYAADHAWINATFETFNERGAAAVVMGLQEEQAAYDRALMRAHAAAVPFIFGE
jgi:hypothetical protein